MTDPNGWAVFTDLDGTLLDHDTYRFEPAEPALARLGALGIPLVLSSSKTAAEIADLHRFLGLGMTPAIVENGAGLYDPAKGSSETTADHDRIRAILGALPAGLRGAFRGFSDMSADEVAQQTGLSVDAAARAKSRAFTEPGVLSGPCPVQEAFLDAVTAAGLTPQRGGRFLSLTFGRTKKDAMLEVKARLRATQTLALGDTLNDIEMLQAADIGILVRNDHAPAVPADQANGLVRTDLPGPHGWNTAVLAVFKDVERA